MTDEVPAVRVATAEVLFWAAMKDAVTRRYDKARAVVAEEMRRAGSEKQRGWDDNGVELGTVTLSEDTQEAEVCDLDALLDWVIEHHPGEHYSPPPPILIREAFLRKLLDEAPHMAADKLPDGVCVKPKAGQVRVLSSSAAKERAAEFTRSSIQALTAGPVAPPPE